MSRYRSSVLTCVERRERRVRSSDSAILSGVGVWSRLGKGDCSLEPTAAASPGQLSFGSTEFDVSGAQRNTEIPPRSKLWVVEP